MMLADLANAHGLRLMGGFAVNGDDTDLAGHATVFLLGPEDRRFWPLFTASPEYCDGAPDPIDRWSQRVLGELADQTGGTAYFPFGGPPHYPFYSWARRTGRVHVSPIRFLVDAEVGLWASFRGAIAYDEPQPLPPPVSAPCADCSARPCLSACPVAALTETGYDVEACKTHIAAQDSASCRALGCAARRACPISTKAQRNPEQSALHMKAFLE
jgi:hypothetical protein